MGEDGIEHHRSVYLLQGTSDGSMLDLRELAKVCPILRPSVEDAAMLALCNGRFPSYRAARRLKVAVWRNQCWSAWQWCVTGHATAMMSPEVAQSKPHLQQLATNTAMGVSR